MKRQECRSKLIEGTIQVIARDGLDKATTKLVGLETGLNEAYIYRCFAGKEDMYAKTFDLLDEELVDKVLENLPVMALQDVPFRERSQMLFTAVWKFVLGNRARCLAYVQYYFSPYFPRLSVELHKRRYKPVVDSFRVVFLDEADVWMIINHIIHTILNFAVKVHNDQMPKDDDYAEHVFRVVYASVEQYFRNKERTNR